MYVWKWTTRPISDSRRTFFLFFFEGLYSQTIKTLKNFKIKNKENIISHGRGNSLRNKVRGCVDLDSPDPLKPLPTGWENTECIASLYSYSQVLTEPVNFPRLPDTSTRRRPIALKMTPVDSPYTHIVSTAIGSNWCASARAAYLRRLCSSARFAAVPASIADLFRCAPAKVSTHVQSQTKLPPPLNGKTVIPSGWDPSPLTREAPKPTAGRLLEALS